MENPSKTAIAIPKASDGGLTRFWRWLKQPGVLLALPSVVVMIILFVVPLILVFSYSFQEQYTFDLTTNLSLQSYKDLIYEDYYPTFGWSLLLAVLTTVFLFVLCYPCAYFLTKIFEKHAVLINLLLLMPLFVAADIRLFGWTLLLMKGGFLTSIIADVFGMERFNLLYNFPVIIMGNVNIYFPFMFFPLTLGMQLIDDTAVEAARTLGANRWQVMTQIEIPMAAPGIFIGSLLTFILSLGSMVEAQMLGGNIITTIMADLHSAFGYQSNWPLGSAIAVVLLAITALLIIFVLRWIDMDKLISGRAKLG